MYKDGAAEILTGCTCGSHFFYFIRKEYADKLKSEEIQDKIEEIESYDKKKMERDVRQIIGITEKEDIPVILDLESIRVLAPGKFEIDVVNLLIKRDH
jgi:predicted  nucleic acid-binding Zn-ribbon protein